MRDLLEFFSLFYFFISITGLAVATYTDFKQRIVPNWLSFGMIGIGLAGHAVQSYFSTDLSAFAIALAVTALTFAVAFVLWKVGVWAGGDVKLFTALAALNPFNPALLSQVLEWPSLFHSNGWPVFPLTLFAFTLLCMLPYAMLLSAVGLAKKKEARKALLERTFPEWKRVLAFAFYSVGFGALLFRLALPWWLLIVVLFVLGFVPLKSQYGLAFVSLLGFIFLQDVRSLEFAIGLAIVLGVIALLWNLQKIAKEFVLVEWKAVRRLEEGDILADSFAWKKGKLFIFQRPSMASLLKLKTAKQWQEFVHPKLALEGGRAAGLLEKEVRQFKSWETQGKWSGKIKVKKSAPLAPAVLLAYVVLNVVGDVLWRFV